MQKTMVLLLVTAMAVVPAVASAQVYEAVNRLKVVSLNASDFEVIEARGEGARGIWCAAADYARVRYGGSGQQRIYIKSPRGASQTVRGRKGVVFTMAADRLNAAPQRSVSVSVRTAGINLSVNHALQFCRDYLVELNDILYPHRR